MYANSIEQLIATKEKVFEIPAQTYAMLERHYENSASFNIKVVDFSAKKMSRFKQPNHIREALEKGYVEMSHINLSICKECLHAEYEAEHMVERLVSGR